MTSLRKHKLGNSDLFVSEIGLGTMSLGTEKLQAQYIIDYAVDSGINFLDTADIYDDGLNEEIVGNSIKSKRQQIILSTKVGNVWNSSEQCMKWDASKKHIHKAVRDSLLRLQTDYIDLYQLHGGMIEDNIPETIEVFEELVKEGLIRNYGISSIRPNVIQEYINHSNVVSVMMKYNLLDRRPEELFSTLEENNISLIARGALAKGILTAKKKLTEKTREKGYESYSYHELEQLFDNLSEIEKIRPLERTAIQFSLQHKIISSSIVGASSTSQLQQNLLDTNETLSNEEYQFLQSITKQDIYQKHR